MSSKNQQLVKRLFKTSTSAEDQQLGNSIHKSSISAKDQRLQMNSLQKCKNHGPIKGADSVSFWQKYDLHNLQIPTPEITPKLPKIYLPNAKNFA